MGESRDFTGDQIENAPLSGDEYREIYHSVNDAIFVHDAETGDIIDVNETMCEMYGYTREQARTLSISDLSSGNPPFTQETAIENVQKAAQGEPQVFEWRAQDSDGELFWVEVSMRRAVFNGVERILVIVRDIDDKKQAKEKEAFLHSLLRHDLSNKLQVIHGYLEAVEEMDAPERIHDLVDRSMGATTESIDLIEKVKTLRSLDERTDRRLRSIDLVVSSAVETYATRAEEAGIEIEHRPINCRLKCSPLLDQVFSNLLENAIDHSGGSQIEIFGECRDDTVRVSVADDGTGLEPSMRTQVMERGVSTGGESGSGLGLALVEEIVTQHGGTVDVTESDTGGTQFDVTLTKFPDGGDD